VLSASMLASFPSQHLESNSRRVGNLEGSVRSRDAFVARSGQRDLIEAGLN